MSKRNSAPTIAWVFTSQFYRVVALLFFVQLLVVFVFLYGIKYHIDRSCYNTYNRDLNVFGYVISVDAGTDVKACLNGT